MKPHIYKHRGWWWIKYPNGRVDCRPFLNYLIDIHGNR